MLSLIRQGLAGALAGCLGFVFMEPGASARDLGQDSAESLVSILPMLLFGGLVSGTLAFAAELPTGRFWRMLRGGILGLLLGSVLGSLSYCCAGAVYAPISYLAQQSGIAPIQIMGRALGWGVFGLGLGLAGGILAGSGRRTRQGMLGGFIGGVIGGAFFDPLSAGQTTAGFSRFVGFTMVGLCVGLFTALVEQLGRVAWLTHLTGSREGRQVLLHKDTLSLGRDELAEVPLFGDIQVERRHATLSLQPQPVIRETGAVNLLRVDGHPVREAMLQDGSLIEIGRHRLRFHHRDLPAGVAQPMVVAMPTPVAPQSCPAWNAAPAYATPPSPAAVAQVTGDPFAALMAAERRTDLVLRIVSAGPLSGMVIPMSGAVTLGREVGNTVQLQDGRASRFHARIEQRDGLWVLTDLGSTNGTRVNAVRITRAGLAPGDQIGIGETLLAVEPARG